MGADPHVNQMKTMDSLYSKIYIKNAPKHSHTINFITLNTDFPYITNNKKILVFLVFAHKS